jgi:hypothetical protein
MIEIRQNEANLINYEHNKELIENLLLIKEEFVEDILRKLKSKNDFEVDFEVDDNDESILKVVWSWNSRKMQNEKAFRLQAQAETKEAFLNKVKCYFFDLIIMIINL